MAFMCCYLCYYLVFLLECERDYFKTQSTHYHKRKFCCIIVFDYSMVPSITSLMGLQRRAISDKFEHLTFHYFKKGLCL